MICDNCDSGIGIVDDPKTTLTMVCPVCNGVGAICGYCDHNYAECTCPEPEPLEKPRKPGDK